MDIDKVGFKQIQAISQQTRHHLPIQGYRYNLYRKLTDRLCFIGM